MAYFYESGRPGKPSWEEVGGFNTQLLEEMRNAMLDVASDLPKPSASSQTAVSDWIKRLPAFDFPDDEIG